MSNSFTPAAHASARSKQSVRSEAKAASFDIPSIFAVRVGTAFGWEARRFGGVIVGRSESLFNTPDLARMVGELASMRFDV